MGERRGDGGQGSVLEETEMKCIAVQCSAVWCAGLLCSSYCDDGGCRERGTGTGSELGRYRL